MPSHATSLGLTPTQSASVISAFGIMNTVGRILVGLISDRKLPCKYGKDRALNRLWIYVSSLSLCGLLTAGVLFCDGYITLAMYSGLFGLTLSSYVCLTSVLLVDLIGIEKLTNAFGLILLFQGIGTVIGPPISGQLADLTGSYDMSFVFCGVALLISGLILNTGRFPDATFINIQRSREINDTGRWHTRNRHWYSFHPVVTILLIRTIFASAYQLINYTTSKLIVKMWL
ncbi:unnamed protein product [Wuchereria bancrofti]|uniref:Major facilitator superfamily (MFS) profile domain-containing protein n=1 Tax=Wuchereria bancrofti TaxID=6293 RepID=A0A3P7EFX7_WUCBA|nr:unnamed protein product [Wuchereria bancrofti]